MASEDKRVPKAIRRRPDGIEIDWGSDGGALHYPARALRLACPCAACVDEMSGRRTLDPAAVPDDIHVAGLELVGAYGVRIRWSDGHSTGIYTFSLLGKGPG